MIIKATQEMTSEIRRIWKECFPEEDPRYIEYYFKMRYKPENCYVNIVNGRIVSTLIRTPHAVMFNGRVLQASMIMGVATLPEYRRKGIAKELLSRVVEEARAYGCGTVQITASDMGVLLYTDFGFVKNGNFMQLKL